MNVKTARWIEEVLDRADKGNPEVAQTHSSNYSSGIIGEKVEFLVTIDRRRSWRS